MSESLSPTYQPALDPVQVPAGCYPIEVVQFWRGEHRRGHPLPLHWTIVVRTSAQRGNTHEIVGDRETYATQDRLDVLLRSIDGRDDWRGSHVVGYVSPGRLDDLLNHVALVPVVRHRWGWNCQNWVFEVLEGLRSPGEMFADEKLTFGRLQAQMMYLLEAWEEGEI